MMCPKPLGFPKFSTPIHSLPTYSSEKYRPIAIIQDVPKDSMHAKGHSCASLDILHTYQVLAHRSTMAKREANATNSITESPRMMQR